MIPFDFKKSRFHRAGQDRGNLGRVSIPALARNARGRAFQVLTQEYSPVEHRRVMNGAAFSVGTNHRGHQGSQRGELGLSETSVSLRALCGEANEDTVTHRDGGAPSDFAKATSDKAREPSIHVRSAAPRYGGQVQQAAVLAAGPARNHHSRGDQREPSIQQAADMVASPAGAVLMILALISAVLLLFAGLAIDGAVLATSKAQQNNNASLTALAALKRYLDAPGTWDVKLEQARLRAQEIAGMNVYVGTPFQQVQGYSQELGTNDPNSPLARTGQIVPGLWHTQPPPDCSLEASPCPCLNGYYNGPCFEELRLDLPENAGKVPNAFRAILYLRNDAPINTLFARAGAGTGNDQVTITSQATATTYPVHGVFLVDLSRSQHFETHVAFETTGGAIETPLSAESAFRLTSQSCPGDHSNPCPSPGSCAIDGGSPPGLYSAVYNYNPPLLLNSRGGSTSAQRHYKSDYKCYTVSYTEDGGSLKTENYLVDAYQGATTPSGYYDGPEPLTTILYGVHRGMEIVQDEAIAGTLIGAIGFDRSATVDIRRFELSSPGDPDFDALKEITDVVGQTDETKRKRYEEHMFFPRIEGYANIPAALNEAKEMLKAAPLVNTSQNFVTIFTDGLTNCAAGGVCGPTEADYLASLNDAVAIIQNDYVQEGIKLNFVHVGSRVRPHTILSASFVEPDKCMTENEARFNNPPLSFIDETGSGVYSDVMKLKPNSGFYFDPARFYEAARATEGLWFPLRPCCLSGGSCADVRSQLDVACDAATPGYTGDQPTPVIVSPHTDGQGRLWCDPKGRDRRLQLDEYMRTLLAETQFATVENF